MMKAWNKTYEEDDAWLVLEDGRLFKGRAFGARAVRGEGELVFNTSMSGYQEILTDPSYAGQIVTLTTAHVGNYGVNAQDMESSKIHVRGLVVRELTHCPSNWRSTKSLSTWMQEQGVVGISGVDTRALTRHIRDCGVMRAVIVSDVRKDALDEVLATLRAAPSYAQQEYVARVSTQVACEAFLESGLVQLRELHSVDDRVHTNVHVVVLDFGTKYSIVRHLLELGVDVTVLPGESSAEEIAACDPDGILLSNGPGDPAQLDGRLKGLGIWMHKRPTFGICLGHQILARALGAETFKLPFGHRGPNQPVLEERTGRVSMTSQNHGYAVRAKTLPQDVEVTHINLNDGTVSGFLHKQLPIRAVQYHPEAGPGPHDARDFFDDFVCTVRAHARAARHVVEPNSEESERVAP